MSKVGNFPHLWLLKIQRNKQKENGFKIIEIYRNLLVWLKLSFAIGEEFYLIPNSGGMKYLLSTGQVKLYLIFEPSFFL